MFSRLSTSTLIELCRALRHYLGAGLTIEEVVRQQAIRGPASVRPIAARMALVLRRGRSLEAALEEDKHSFPPLFLSLARVGERTGMMPEVFAELEKYFEGQQTLRRRFIALTAWPMLQFILAVFVLAGVILIIGLLNPQTMRGQPYDPLGLGLRGPTGALIFLGSIFGGLFGMWLGYWLAGKLLPPAFRDRFLLAIPAIGPCLRDLALMRFCLALRLTTESGMAIDRAIRLSMEATGNAAFVAASPVAEQTVRDGDELTKAMAKTHLIPGDFLRILQVAEESGQLTEVLKHQGDHYNEQATRRMTFLTVLLGGAVWLSVGAMLVVAIFRMYMSYLDLLNF